MKVYKTKDGAWQLNYSMDGRQRQIYLGLRHDAASAGRVLGVVKELLVCRYRGESPPPKLIERLKRLDWKIQASVRRHGILSDRFVDVTLEEMIRLFMETKKSLAPITLDSYDDRFERVRRYFGTKKILNDVTEDDVIKFKAYLLGERGLAPCTVSRNIYDLRSMFRYTTRWVSTKRRSIRYSEIRNR